MRFTKVQTAQFRNLATASYSTDVRRVMLVGENGQGKTNFLEMLYVLCYGSSFRSQNLRDLVRIGCDSFKITGWYNTGGEPFDHELSCTFRQGKRTVTIDGKTVIDRRELVQTIPCIVFSHGDISFVNGDPEQRRRFFDQTMSMYDAVFLDHLRRYKMILKQRNQAIKDGTTALLPIYDSQLAEHGLFIRDARAAAVEEFDSIFPDLYASVSGTGERVAIEYAPSWKDEKTVDDVVNTLAENSEHDMTMLTTTSGIHRDRFLVKKNGKLMVDVGSTGQIRLASLLFRVAQMRFFKKKTGRNPVILVDDVLLELDKDKRARFLDVIEDYDQAFFTFLPEESYFASLNKRESIVYHVSQGEFVRNA